MAFLLADVEVTRPLSAVAVPPGHRGLALVVLRRGKPIGFAMRTCPAGTVYAAGELGELISRAAGAKLLQEHLRDELTPPFPAVLLPALSIAVCTRDHPDMLARCLESLQAARSRFGSLGLGSSVEILVVDNAPPDERSREVAARFSDVRYVREPKAGLNFARNRAVAEARGELVAFVDDDTVADREWIAGLAEAWNENPDAAAFTGLVLPLELATPAQVLFEERGGFRRGFEKLRYQGQTLEGDPLYPCGAGRFGAGCNMAFRLDVVRELGGFDEALDTGAPLPGGGDLDIFYRVIRGGHALVYEPRFMVRHQHRRAYADLRRQYWTWGTGFMAFIAKSYRTDPARRRRLRRTIRWWFGYQGRQALRRAARLHTLPFGLLAAEFLGGIVGLAGTYERSLRRTAAIRRRNS